MRTEVRRAFNQAKSKHPAKIEARKAAQRLYNKAVRRSKRVKFQQFCNTVSSTSGTSRLFKSLSKNSSNPLGSLKLPSGEFTDTPEATLQHLLETHFPGCHTAQVQLEVGYLFNNVSTDEVNISMAKSIVSKEKIAWASRHISQQEKTEFFQLCCRKFLISLFTLYMIYLLLVSVSNTFQNAGEEFE